MLWIYRLIALVLAPIALWRLDRLDRATSSWVQQQQSSRRGLFVDQPPTQAIDLWFHCASVGEVNTVAGLIQHAIDSDLSVLVTTFTPTGLEHAKQCLDDRVYLAFAPIDTHYAVKRWLANYQPQALVVAETELWPELFYQCHQRHIPVMLVNARLSAHHLKRTLRFKSLFKAALTAIEFAACQTETEKTRWVALGLDPKRIVITGNLKAHASAELDPSAQALKLPRFCWTAGSVHPEEYAQVIEAHVSLLEQQPNAKLIIAPRHLKYVEDIERRLDNHQLNHQRFDPSTLMAQADRTQVWVIDGFGQLMVAYAASDVAFVGGSLVDVGGHNVYEPAALEKPVITGPHTHQQQGPVAELLAQGGLIEVNDSESLAKALLSLASDPAMATTMGQAARAVVLKNAHSLEKTWALIRKTITSGA